MVSPGIFQLNGELFAKDRQCGGEAGELGGVMRIEQESDLFFIQQPGHSTTAA